jgi:RND family efflux transporter MFP subunit
MYCLEFGFNPNAKPVFATARELHQCRVYLVERENCTRQNQQQLTRSKQNPEPEITQTMKPVYTIAAASLLVLSSCAGSGESKKETDKDSTKTNSTLPIVSAETISFGEFQHYIEVQGVIEADKIANLTSSMGGLVKQILVEEGQHVNAGQTLVMLDADVINKNIQEVEKNLELAVFVYEKQKNLFEQNIGSELQFQQAKNNKERLEQTLETLKEQRSQLSIVAPFEGVVDEIFLKLGEMTGPQMPVVRLINLSRVHIAADVMETYLKSVSKNKMVDIHIESIDTTMKNIPIIRTGKFINPSNRTFKVEVEMANPGDRLLPNMVAIMRIKHEVLDSVLTVPSEAVLQSNSGQNYVYILNTKDKKNIITKVNIETGPADDERTVVFPLEGAREQLKSGDAVVVNGARGVKPGMEVQVVK